MLEPPPAPRSAVRHDLAGFRGIYLVNAVVAFLFAATAPVAIVLTIGQQGRLTQADVASWLFAAFFVNGLVSLAFCLLYRQPLVLLWTIPGSVLVGQALEHFSFAQVIGTFYATGVLMLVLGLSGWMRKCMSRIPMPIIMAMVAGVFLQFGLNLIFAVRDGTAIAAAMAAAFFLLSASPRLARFLPPVIGALIVGGAVTAFAGGFDLPAAAAASIAKPNIYAPELSGAAMVELVLPLAITVLAAQNAQGFAILEAVGHKPPINTITAACGLVSLITALFGSVSTCFTGPVTAILVSGGEKDRHYLAGIVTSVLAVLFGLFARSLTQLMLAIPKVLVAALAGLALLKVLQRAFVISFGGTFTFGALVAFLVAVANVPIFSIGAPFWAVLIGIAASWLLERDDFAALRAD